MATWSEQAGTNGSVKVSPFTNRLSQVNNSMKERSGNLDVDVELGVLNQLTYSPAFKLRNSS